MVEGVLIGESLADYSILESLDITDNYSIAAEEPTKGQPTEFTLFYFQMEDDEAPNFAQLMSKSFAPGRWYADFQSADKKWVIFPGRIFNYLRTDASQAAAAKEYGVSLGIPEGQLGWTE